MRAIITVFKAELADKPTIFEGIRAMSAELTELTDAYTFSPKPGKLFDLLNLLKNDNVNYGTHFNLTDEQT
jgi:hypothetical protein